MTSTLQAIAARELQPEAIPYRIQKLAQPMSADDEPVLIMKPLQRPGLTLFAAVSGVCSVVGFLLALVSVPHFLVWLGVGFAGVLGLVYVSYRMPGNSALILTPHGFTVRFASRLVYYPWSEVDYFAVAGERRVAFRLLDHSERISPSLRHMTGFDGALPASYGALPAEQLAARLNECCLSFRE